jgi:hypothetical protein
MPILNSLLGNWSVHSFTGYTAINFTINGDIVNILYEASN